MCHLNIKLLLQENMKDGKFCNDEVVGFDSAFEGVFQNLISLALSNWNKEKQFLHWFLERICWPCCCFWEKPDIIFGSSGVGSMKEILTGKPSNLLTASSGWCLLTLPPPPTPTSQSSVFGNIWVTCFSPDIDVRKLFKNIYFCLWSHFIKTPELNSLVF